MPDIEFWVDRDLRLIDCNAEFRKTLKFFGEEGAYPYYEVFPRIFCGDRDAVELALEKGKALSFQDYGFSCL